MEAEGADDDHRRRGIAAIGVGATVLFGAAACDVKESVRWLRSDAPAIVEVELVEMAYRPDEIVVEAGEPTRLLLRNVGTLEHDFSVDDLNLSPNVRPGEEGTVEIAAPAGRYRVYCTFPGHEEAGMVGIMIVRP